MSYYNLGDILQTPTKKWRDKERSEQIQKRLGVKMDLSSFDKKEEKESKKLNESDCKKKVKNKMDFPNPERSGGNSVYDNAGIDGGIEENKDAINEDRRLSLAKQHLSPEHYQAYAELVKKYDVCMKAFDTCSDDRLNELTAELAKFHHAIRVAMKSKEQPKPKSNLNESNQLSLKAGEIFTYKKDGMPVQIQSYDEKSKKVVVSHPKGAMAIDKSQIQPLKSKEKRRNE